MYAKRNYISLKKKVFLTKMISSDEKKILLRKRILTKEFGFAWSLRIANNVSSIHVISQNGMPFWLKDQDPDPSRSKL